MSACACCATTGVVIDVCGESSTSIPDAIFGGSDSQKLDGMAQDSHSVETAEFYFPLLQSEVKFPRGSYVTYSGEADWRISEFTRYGCHAQMTVVRPFMPCLEDATVFMCDVSELCDAVPERTNIGVISAHRYLGRDRISDALGNTSLQDQKRIYFKENPTITWAWKMGQWVEFGDGSQWKIAGVRNQDLIDRAPYLEVHEEQSCCGGVVLTAGACVVAGISAILSYE